MNDKPTKKYEGAAISGEHPRIDKILQMHNFFSKAINQFKVRVQYIAATRQINISNALQQVHSQGLKIENSQIFFENAEMKMYMYLGTFPFENPVYLKHQFCPDSLIRIKYKKLSDSPKNTNANNTQNNKGNQSHKGSNIKPSPKNPPKQRRKQATIEQALDSVKIWKKMQVDENGNKIRTLSEAADLIGVNKKTLEDYAYQIQFGYEFNFDFDKSKHFSIGVLRTFVKNKRKQMAILNNIDNYWNLENSSSDEDFKGGR